MSLLFLYISKSQLDWIASVALLLGKLLGLLPGSRLRGDEPVVSVFIDVESLATVAAAGVPVGFVLAAGRMTGNNGDRSRAGHPSVFHAMSIPFPTVFLQNALLFG